MIGSQQKESGGSKQSDAEKKVFSPPSISLPKGGGAIRGIGEKFAANPVTGTGSMSVPLYTSPGRSGFGPQLSLSYDSGAGNGPLGFGWNLSLPSITRKTDKGLPRYQDSNESDVFILSGAEDLVPVLKQNECGDWVPETCPPRTIGGSIYLIQRYRPRIEGLFARIERWSNQDNPKDMFWRSISKDNITTWYGKNEESRIFDPEDPKRIFSWLICESHDDKGNVISYRYKEENSDDVRLSRLHERNRTDKTRQANRYLKRIRYGNHSPYFQNLSEDQPWPTVPEDDAWFFEVVFDYGEHDGNVPMPNDQIEKWKCRNDPFSSYRSGFEVRTYRLCQRVLMFHHFPKENDVSQNCLVRSTDFKYSYEEHPQNKRNPFFSFLLSVTQSGYKRKSSGYLKKSFPPLEFEYTQPEIDETTRDVDPESFENLPSGLDGSNYQWVDLNGEGLSGILTEQGGSWFYKSNLSPVNLVNDEGIDRVDARFAPVKLVAQIPSLANLAEGRQQLLDLSADGKLNLVSFQGTSPGFYERTEDELWESFIPFNSLPVVNWNDPKIKFIDLTGDGHADMLITEDDVFIWHPSLGEDGFDSAQRVAQALNEEKGPRLVFSDASQSIYLADFSGDGLTDIVRIRNGNVCFWSNKGFARFGPKVTMDNSPWFDNPDQFSQQRIRLVDIDGSGVTDIIYISREGVNLYFNQSGNSWSEARQLKRFPQVDNLSSVMTVDLLGNGTACLVWSSPLPYGGQLQMRYIDLMGGQKPHLLIKSINNLGAETLIHYAPSTKFYVADKLNGKPWITKIPFPVQVVERVETYDRISRNRFVTGFDYHHGFFDGEEREFRGFGRVDQWDTEEFGALTASSEFPVGDNVDASSHVPPVLTRTWFHTGVYLGRDRVSNFFAGLLDQNDVGEYYREPGLSDSEARELLVDDTVLPPGLTEDEEREACRALKGSMLRQEIYAQDGTEKEKHPYTVTEQNFTIELLQPKQANRYSVFLSHTHESTNYQYERNPKDPRMSHSFTLRVDAFGNIERMLVVGYPRREVLDRQTEQNETHMTFIVNTYINKTDEQDWYRVGLSAETRTYEIAKPPRPLSGFDTLFRFDELKTLTENLFPIGQHHPFNAGMLSFTEWNWRAKWKADEKEGLNISALRLIEHVRTVYRKNDLTSLLAIGQLESLALPGETYKLTFTPELIAQVYEERVTDEMLAGEGGYVHSEGDLNWWIPSGRIFYSPDTDDEPSNELEYARAHFFHPHRYRDPFHTDHINTETFVTYDTYNLLVLETRDALGNRTTVGERSSDSNETIASSGYDYRVLQPSLTTDPNSNRSVVVHDALGLVTGIVSMGKTTENLGDFLDQSFQSDLSDDQVDVFISKPREVSSETNLSIASKYAHDLLGSATTRIIYGLDRYLRFREPTFAATINRETHISELEANQRSRLQVSFAYSDGFGREIQKKVQAEAGLAAKRDAFGKIKVATDGQPEMTQNEVNPRWLGSGWTVFNNKGKPIRQFEPFFTDTYRFEFDARIGVSPIVFYDPVERVVATLHPNHTWEKVVFDPWRQEKWDVCDNALLSDPKKDVDVGTFFGKLQVTDYLPTWINIRQTGNLGPYEQAAASKVSIYANTPTVAHADSLGRTFITIAHNKYKYSDKPPADSPEEEFYRTRILFDSEGNEREIIDAKDRIIMRYDYDLLGNRIHETSMEAGERWVLNDVADKILYVWDSRNHKFHNLYDALRRPTDSFLIEGSDTKVLVGRTEYGETRDNSQATNLRGKVVQVFDQTGVVSSDEYDFKGNLLHSQRQLAMEYKTILDWSSNVELLPDIYASRTSYDALNRPIELTFPDNTVIRPNYNEANLLDRVDANLHGEQQNGERSWMPFVKNIDYDTKGQRTQIVYGNGVRTTYTYDPLTFRLMHLLTRRDTASFPDDCPESHSTEWPGCDVQNLHYTYDPAGNITYIRDDSQQTIYFRNKRVDPSAEYTYDAVYRLIEASGREHLGERYRPSPSSHKDKHKISAPLSSSDGNAMGRYLERYTYDAAGNFKEMVHRSNNSNNPGWSRRYDYNEPSPIEPTKHNNRLTKTNIGEMAERYSIDGHGYDAHGNLLQMPHLQIMQWNFKDQLQMIQNQIVKVTNDVDDQHQGERTWYVYDTGGLRSRKINESANGQVKNERIYLGNFEIYREYKNDPSGSTLERETLHIMDGRQRVAIVEKRTKGSNSAPEELIRYQFSNHLGSSSLELDNEAQIISYEEYLPYGSTSYQAVRSQTETPKRYRFTSKEHDEESGFYYHGARYFVSWLGRWVNCDPESLNDGSNLYLYVACNPIRRIDPTGTNGQPPPGLIADHPKLAKLWEQAAQKVLEPKFGGGSFKENLRMFKENIEHIADTVGMGSNRAKGTGINVSRETYSKVRTAFGHLAEEAKLSVKGMQIHHAIDQVASNPGESLNPTNLNLSRGNAASRGSLHWRAHQALDRAKDALARFRAKWAGSSAAAETAENIAKPIVSRGGQRGFTTLGTMFSVLRVAGVALAPVAAYDFGKDAAAGKIPEAIASGSAAIAGGFEAFSMATGVLAKLGVGGVAAAPTVGPLASVAAAPIATVGAYVAGGAAIGATVGIGLEKGLEVSEYTAAIGMKADAAVASLGGGEGLRTAAGVTATIGATVGVVATLPLSVTAMAVDRLSGSRIAKWLGS